MQWATGRISQTVWDFTYCPNKKISFRLLTLIKCTVICSLLCFFLQRANIVLVQFVLRLKHHISRTEKCRESEVRSE